MSKSKARKLAEFLRNLNDNSKLDTTGFADNRYVTTRADLESKANDTDTFVTTRSVTQYVDNKIQDFVVDTTDFNLTFSGHMTGTATVSDFGDTTISLAAHSSLGTNNVTEHADYPYFTNARADARIVAAGSANWNTAYGWGNHASAGYLTSYTETDTLATVTGRGATTTNAISTGAITSSGNIGAASGHVSGKFAVKSSGVHGSYDLYNNGTTYLNGSTIVDDTLNLTGGNAKLQIGSVDVIDTNRVLKNITRADFANFSVTGTSTTSPSILRYANIGANPEGSHLSHPFFFNDLANFEARGGTVTVSGLSGGATLTECFRANGRFSSWSNGSYSGSTMTITLTNLPHGLSYGGYIGIAFGNTSWCPSSCKIEVSTDGGSTWTTRLNSSSAKEMYFTTTGTGGTAANAIRFTIGQAANTSSIRCTHIWAYNYNSNGMEDYFLSKAGGTLFGTLNMGANAITSTGSITASSYSGSLASSVTATTQSSSDNSTKVATTAYVTTAVDNIVGAAPGSLDTLNELAAALGDDANFSTTVTNSIATKLPLAGGTMTGKLTINNASYANHLELVRGSDTVYLTPSGGQLITNGGFSPDVTNTDDLGRTDKYWQNLWLGTSLKMGGTTVIDSSRQFLVNSHIYFGGSTNQSFIRQQNTNLEFFGDGNHSFRTYNGGWYERLNVDDGGINVTGTIEIGGTTVIDTNRNLTNIVGIGLTGSITFGNNTTSGRYDIVVGSQTTSRGMLFAPYVTFGTRYSGWDLWQGTNIRTAVGTTNSGIELATSFTTNGASALNVGFQGLNYYTWTSSQLSGLSAGSSLTLGTPKFSISQAGNATFVGTISSGAITSSGAIVGSTVQATGNLYGTTGLHTLNTAGNGWNHTINRNSGNPTANLPGGITSGAITSSGTVTASGGNSGQWNTAYGWGNHASAGYLTSSSSLDASNLNSGTLSDSRLGSTVFRSRGSVNVTTSSGGSNSNPFDDAHTETRVAEYGARMIGYTGASATMLSINTGGSASVFQIGAHYNGNDFHMRTRTDSSTWQTWKKLWHTGNDGSGSGLDADTVDGIHGSQFLRSDAGDTATGNIVFSGATQYFRKNNATNYTNGSLMVESYGGASSIAAMGFHISGSLGRMLSMNSTGLLAWEDDFYAAGYIQSNSSISALTTVTANQGFVVPNTSSYGLRSTNGANYFLPLDPHNNMHIRSSTGSEFHDSTAYYFRRVDQSNIVTITASNTNIAAGTLTRAGNTVWDSGNDGSGSGLDADLLDGQHASAFAPIGGSTGRFVTGGLYGTGHGSSILPIWQYNAGNPGYGIGYEESSPDRLRMDVTNNLMSGTPDFELIPNELRINGNKVWNAGNDGSGSGLDADLLDGKNSTDFTYYRGIVSGDWDTMFTTGTGKTLTSGLYEVHDISNTDTNYPVGAYTYGGVFAWYLNNSTFKLYAPHTGTLWYQTGWVNDEYSGWRKIWDNGNDGSGSGLDADLLDGIQGSAFLRTDISQSPTNVISLRAGGAHLGNHEFAANTNQTSYANSSIELREANYGGTSSYSAPRISFHWGGVVASSIAINTSGDILIQDNPGTGYENLWAANIYSNSNLVWHAGNDSSGSGLDADLLDGQQGSYYYAASNPSGYITSSGTASQSHMVTGSAFATTNAPHSVLEYQQASGQTDTKLAPSTDWHNTIRMGHGNPYSYYSSTIAVRMTGGGTGDLYTQNIGNNSANGWRKHWSDANDGAGSGLDADLLDGQHGSYYDQSQFGGTTFYSRNSSNPITIDTVTTNMVGYVTGSTAAGYSDGAGFSAAYSSAWVGQLFVDFRTGKLSTRGKNNGTWQSHRFMWNNLNDGSGSGLDADLLDGNDSTAFPKLAATNTWGNNAINYFRVERGGYSGSINTANLQAYTTGANSAFMSFHRSGLYAVNFGLDADNALRIGGWSAAANRWVLDMSGNMTAAGNVTAYSDIRLKENIEVIPNALEKVKQIRGVTFTRNDQDDKELLHTGVIAQEVEKVLPEVVSEDNLGVKNVAYGNMVGLLIEAIKELKQEVDDLKSQLKEK